MCVVACRAASEGSRRHTSPLRFLLGVIVLFAGICPAEAQPATLRGFVTDRANGQALELVNVAVAAPGGPVKGGVTSRDGLYLIPNIDPGRYALRASFIGYQTYVDTLDLAAGEQRTVNIALVPGDAALNEVLVESERTSGAARVTAGQQTVRPRDIELIPTPDLSGDLAGFLTTLPGVVAVGDRGGQLFIRGGEPSQNLVQIDGVLLYQPFHVLGFYSAFPADLLSRADIYAGGFGSKFGERISSVIDITARSGNNQRFAGAVTLSPFISSARLEGPLIRDRLSLLASVRRSLVEEGAARLVSQPLPFTFGDAFAKLHGIVSKNSRASILGLQTYDRGVLTEDTGGLPPEEIRWTNRAAGARFLVLPHLFSLSADVRASYSYLETDLGPREAPSRQSSIENADFAVDGTFFGEHADVDVGIALKLLTLKNRLGGLYQNIEVQDEDLEHASAYVEPEFKVGAGLRVRPGLRVQFFDVRFDPFLEPRLRVVWILGAHQLSGAAGVYDQAILGLNDRRDAASVFTVWTNVPRPRTDLEDVRAGRAQRAVHALLGYRATPVPWLEVSVEGFYKRLSNLFIGEWTAFPRFTTQLQPATGRSFGFDARLEMQGAKVYGYVNYGFSSTEYEAEQASLLLWYGEETLQFHPPHDRRHQVNALISGAVLGFEVSVRWEFGSGLPFSQALGFDGFALINDITSAGDVPGFRRVIYERPFNARLPTYHRLDASIERTFPLGVADLTLQGSLINIYDRRNLFYLDVFTLRRVDQLPLVPSLGLKLEIP